MRSNNKLCGSSYGLVPIEQDTLTLPFFVVVSFLAGFSERWTRMMLSGAMRTVAEREQEPPLPEVVTAPSEPA